MPVSYLPNILQAGAPDKFADRLAVGFAALFFVYATVTAGLGNGPPPSLWTLSRVISTCCAIVVGWKICRLGKKPPQIAAYLTAAVCGGLWILLWPSLYGFGRGLERAIPVGAAIWDGAIAGLYGMRASTLPSAAVIGALALAFQIFLDVSWFLLICPISLH
jgi:hypothetical protein